MRKAKEPVVIQPMPETPMSSRDDDLNRMMLNLNDDPWVPLLLIADRYLDLGIQDWAYAYRRLGDEKKWPAQMIKAGQEVWIWHPSRDSRYPPRCQLLGLRKPYWNMGLNAMWGFAAHHYITSRKEA